MYQTTNMMAPKIDSNKLTNRIIHETNELEISNIINTIKNGSAGFDNIDIKVIKENTSIFYFYLLFIIIINRTLYR